ncbi:MAG: toprim domain-containing protein [Bacteroidota bacterium]|nr:toprim domain-containing protein [Bacteroidota bacterium]
MIMRNKPLSCAEVNKRSIVDYLSSLGFEPTRISRHHYWYLSPFRKERTASFKVNSLMNCWYDFGEGRGGTLVDFGILYFKCSVSEFLHQFVPDFYPHQRSVSKEQSTMAESEEILQIRKIKTINSPRLINYLKERKIDLQVAKEFCKEVAFQIRDKSYCAIGFKNDAGGYELRNPFFKGSSHPKDITTLSKGSESLSVFEGFFDFLSYRIILKNSEKVSQDFLILNSLSFSQKIESSLANYKEVNLFLDCDRSGKKAASHLLSLGSHIQDKSYLYRNHKDFNDWLMHFGLRSDEP